MNRRQKIMRRVRGTVVPKHGSLGRFQTINDDDLGYTGVADFVRSTGYVLVEIGFCENEQDWEYSFEGLYYSVSVREGDHRKTHESQ